MNRARIEVHLLVRCATQSSAAIKSFFIWKLFPTSGTLHMGRCAPGVCGSR